MPGIQLHIKLLVMMCWGLFRIVIAGYVILWSDPSDSYGVYPQVTGIWLLQHKRPLYFTIVSFGYYFTLSSFHC